MRKSQAMATLVLTLGMTGPLRANELKIVDVRRNIPLRDDDPVYKDFYINGGTKDGLKNNLVITAVRKTNIRDASGQQSIGELMVPVAQLKVIYTHESMAVAREYKLLSREELPMLEQIGVMSGDLLDLKGSFVEKRKPDSIATPTPVSQAPAAATLSVAAVTPAAVAPVLVTPASAAATQAPAPAAEKSTDAYAAPTVAPETPSLPLSTQ